MLLSLALLSALYFKTSDGNIYHTIDKIPDGMCVLNNNGEELVYEATNFNTCNEITLQPGCYRAELRGGIGLQNEYCLDIVEHDLTRTESAIFNISEPTTVYVLRGGDGNAGDVNVVGNYTGAFGGGASGVDSILVVGDRVWRASGGAGKTCSSSIKVEINRAGAHTTIAVGNGVGGNSELVQLVSQKRVYGSSNPYRYGIGGGGGASPNGAGGTDWQYHHDFINGDEYVNAGTNGTDERGGNGGDIYVCKNFSCTSMVSATGGTGGATVTYECGGQTAKTYGGGGGGGAYHINNGVADGGDGGSGSTGHSDTSFVRIYKI
ncbi:MAG: hypothetical protein E7007_04655 [Alphaproteobacteria bacterium]|nr:hypothetical protein [Alphaproteobacteria bacterium]